MLNIDTSKLNPLEQKIHHTISEVAAKQRNLTITKAAELCGCSISKISKCVHKLGFQNYKQYMRFIYGESLPAKESSSELERIKNFLEQFDTGLVDEFIELIDKYDKIVLFGYGPSYICAEYFEYKLRIVKNKMVTVVSDEVSAVSLMDSDMLLIVFSTTGRFKSFAPIFDAAQKNDCEVLLIAEEYNTELLNNCEKVFFLTKDAQSPLLSPHEKSRVITFIFIEEVIRKIILDNRSKENHLDDTSAT